MADTSMFGDWDTPAGEAVAPAAVEPAVAADAQQAPVDFMGEFSAPAENGVLEGGQGTDMLQADVPQEADPFAPQIGDVGAGMDAVAEPVDLPLGDDSAAAPAQDFMGAEFGAADDLGGLGNGMPAEAPVVGLGAEEAEPEIEDARVAWRQQNYEMLKQKDVEEDGLRSEGRQKAQEERELFMRQRTATIDEKRKLNREMQTALETGPRGAGTWERVLSMVDMKFDPGRHRDVERLKMLMFAAREKAPVAASG